MQIFQNVSVSQLRTNKDDNIHKRGIYQNRQLDKLVLTNVE